MCDFPEDLAQFRNRGSAMSASIEGAFLAQLEKNESPGDLPPARFATVATRAAILAQVSIDWSAEVGLARQLPAGYLAALAVKLGAGEIDPAGALAELTEREAAITCRVGGIFLCEVVRLSTEPPPPEG